MKGNGLLARASAWMAPVLSVGTIQLAAMFLSGMMITMSIRLVGGRMLSLQRMARTVPPLVVSGSLKTSSAGADWVMGIGTMMAVVVPWCGTSSEHLRKAAGIFVASATVLEGFRECCLWCMSL